MKIVADSKIPYLKGLLETVAQEVLYLPAAEITSEVVRDAKVLLTRTRTRCNRALLEGSDVEFIGTATIGTDHIDLDYCRDHGITVANAPGCNAPAVAQWVHCAIIEWLKANHITGSITLGIVGVGHVGSIVARWAQQLGYRIVLNDPPLAERLAQQEIGDCTSALPSQLISDRQTDGQCPLPSQLSPLNSKPSTLNPQLSPLNSLLKKCDIITFHTPLTDGGNHPTWHLCDSAFLKGLKKCRLIINAARGAVCDNEALLNWNGDLALDCWENEPNINLKLLDKAFVATPHIAGYSRQGKQRGTAMILEALNRHYGWNLPVQQPDKPFAGAAHVTPELITSSYNPLIDTEALKSSPERFEALRNTYPMRNEV